MRPRVSGPLGPPATSRSSSDGSLARRVMPTAMAKIELCVAAVTPVRAPPTTSLSMQVVVFRAR